MTSKGIKMGNFESRFLTRKFPVIWFVGTVEVIGKDKPEAKPAPESTWKKVDTVESPAFGSINKADDGYTLEELIDYKKKLENKEVTLRAMVVKVSGNIMGNEWYHVQDGTGGDASLDLIITTKDKVNAGEIVLITGKLGLNRDFGSGYRYEMIIEEATLKVEK